jgi:hypothetical protein
MLLLSAAVAAGALAGFALAAIMVKAIIPPSAPVAHDRRPRPRPLPPEAGRRYFGWGGSYKPSWAARVAAKFR